MSSDRPPASLEGSFVRLRPISREDYRTLFTWRSSFESVHMLNFRRHVATLEEFTSEIEALLRGGMFLMCELPSGEPIGYAIAYQVNQWDGWLFAGVYLEERYRATGHGGEAVLLAIDFVFRWFPVRKVYTEVYEFAQPLGQMLGRLGFREVGYQPDHYWHDDRFWGLYRLCADRDDWNAKRGQFAEVLETQRELDALRIGEPV